MRSTTIETQPAQVQAVALMLPFASFLDHYKYMLVSCSYFLFLLIEVPTGACKERVLTHCQACSTFGTLTRTEPRSPRPYKHSPQERLDTSAVRCGRDLSYNAWVFICLSIVGMVVSVYSTQEKRGTFWSRVIKVCISG